IGDTERAANMEQRVDVVMVKGLSNGQINDHVRLTAIADVYSALIDKRAYKGSMTSEMALEIMVTLEDELDMDLVHEFRSFTLDKG
ncbi:MAG: hypothetical protein ACE1ZV_06270, partial [Alphaproteobacteria bacterium]